MTAAKRRTMIRISQPESHHISVLAGQGDVDQLRTAVQRLAQRENSSTGKILLACRDDYHQTAAHMAAKSGKTSSIDALAGLFDDCDDELRRQYFNTPNRFSGDRPVHTAMRHGYFEVFRALVRHGADPTVKNRFGDSTVDYDGDHDPQDVMRIIQDWVQAQKG